jgi:hypothetical protein
LVYLVAAIIVLIVLIIVGILVVPFQISVELLRQNTTNQGYIRIRWLKIKIIDRELIKPPSKKEKAGKKVTKKREFDFNRIPKIISLSMESFPEFMNILKSFLRSVSIERISLNSIIGLGDSADTAMVGGFLYSVVAVVNVLPNTYFSVEPDLQNERLEGSLNVKLKLILLWIVLEFLKALTKKPFRSLLGELRKMRG